MNVFTRVSADAKRNLYVFQYVFKINNKIRRMTNNIKNSGHMFLSNA